MKRVALILLSMFVLNTVVTFTYAEGTATGTGDTNSGVHQPMPPKGDEPHSPPTDTPPPQHMEGSGSQDGHMMPPITSMPNLTDDQKQQLEAEMKSFMASMQEFQKALH